jgi:hypothetical protein
MKFVWLSFEFTAIYNLLVSTTEVFERRACLVSIEQPGKSFVLAVAEVLVQKLVSVVDVF